MFNRFRKKSELEEINKSLIEKNAELVNTIEELRLENLKLKEDYLSSVDDNNEILDKLNKSHGIVETEDSLAAEEVNQSATYLDPLTSRIVALDENEELKKINAITQGYFILKIDKICSNPNLHFRSA